MAATRLISLHLNKGKSAAQCLKARADYVKDEKKTENGAYISSYRCDPKTVDCEFLLTRSRYLNHTDRTGVHDVLAYQIRQSFKPGEITPEEANRVGYETAMRFTKGKYAFIVCTHTDHAHIHNHVLFNAVSLDCSRKFRDFYLSAMALQRLSDQICLEHSLSVIQQENGRHRSKRTSYPKRTSNRELLRQDIDEILRTQPGQFPEFLKRLEGAGYEIKKGKTVSVRKKGQQRFIRFDSLGEGYSAVELKLIVEQKKTALRPRQEDPISHLIDIQAKLAEGKGKGYENWARNFNLQQSAQAILYMKQNGYHDLEELSSAAEELTEKMGELSSEIRQMENQLNEISVLRKHLENFSRYRKVYQKYKASGYSADFKEAHRQELTLYEAATNAFHQRGKKPLPKISELNEQYRTISAKKGKAYAELKQLRKEQREALTVKKNIEILLNAAEHTDPVRKSSRRR